MYNIISYTTALDTARALALQLQESIAASAIFHLAVSGGSTPKLLFKALVEIKTNVEWDKLRLYWVDERCVPPVHEESNYLMTKLNLLDHVPLADEHVFRMKGELAPEEGLKDYQEQIKGLPQVDGLPQFDLIILGMGDDGHTASIFPPEKTLIDVESDLAIGTNPYSGQKRLTLTGRTIKHAKQLTFHVTGSNKATVLDAIFKQKGAYKDYPASYFNSANTTWVVDKEALLK